VTLAWLYVSWAVVLGGAEVAAAFEGGSEPQTRDVRLSRRAVALELLLQAGERFKSNGRDAIEPHVVAERLDLGTADIRDVLEPLLKAGWLAPVEGVEEHYILARDPAAIELDELERLVSIDEVPPKCDPRIEWTFGEVDEARSRTARRWTLADLLAKPVEEECGPESEPTEGA